MKGAMYVASSLVLLSVSMVTDGSSSVEDVSSECVAPVSTSATITASVGSVVDDVTPSTTTCPPSVPPQANAVCTCSVLLCVDPDETVIPTPTVDTSTCLRFSADSAVSVGSDVVCTFTDAQINDLVQTAGLGTDSFALQATLTTTDPFNGVSSDTSPVQTVTVTDAGTVIALPLDLTTDLGSFTLNLSASGACANGDTTGTCAAATTPAVSAEGGSSGS